ncbi:hypothetical protein KFL_000110240 [Klebsormidium nitens]|uniref:Uncharacterized protein n=1 Tax=Klebsormidium nitens TaxID=105231 RepID=A0A1Y1HP21_KLENI|nr:hypothetical protein KFL_000110240 [Klebsormidium nitens]|eukprot:GAQ78327.1 hypothetical protein KFL_000110240 [Klebsormidium nitens]
MASAARLSLLCLVSAAVLSGVAAQQVNVPVTVQCLNVLENNQILNIPGANWASAIGPINLGVLGQGTLTPCYNQPPAGGRKLLQQINVPVTVQCLNLLENNQILNIPGLNVGVIQLILAALGGAGQAPTALFYNTGSSTNNCVNNQTFNSNSRCSSAIGPINAGILGQGTLIPCYNTPATPAPTAAGRKLLQQVNVPVTAQCVNLLDNSQIANIPMAVVQVIEVIAAVAGGGGQTPSAIFYNTGTSTNNCQNIQTFNTSGYCSSAVGPVNAGVLGQGSLITCYPPPPGGRKLLQQINIPITVQCVNLLNNNQIGNIPNLNVGVIQLILSALGAGGQDPTAVFFNSQPSGSCGTSTNHCENNQEFNNYSKCSSAVGPVSASVLGQGTLIACYG